jgi:hypothetical protein
MAPCKRPNGTISKEILFQKSRFIANGKPLMLRSIRRTVLEWSHRLAWPRTEPSQGLNTGSNPVGTTTLFPSPLLELAFFIFACTSSIEFIGQNALYRFNTIGRDLLPQVLPARTESAREPGRISANILALVREGLDIRRKWQIQWVLSSGVYV